jgi:hypothetical protein
MNRIRPSARCLLCGRDLVQGWTPTPDELPVESMRRQTGNGLCDPCQLRRYAAAIEYIRAKDEMALLSNLGATNKFIGPDTKGSMAMRAVKARLLAADERCIALQMWTASRPYPRGKRKITHDHHPHHRTPRLSF